METESLKEVRPYGLWPSPVSPTLISLRLRLEDVQWDSDGRTLVWLEGRSGQGVLVCSGPTEAMCDLTEKHNVRGGVGYGGGAYTVHHGTIIFAEKDGRLYLRQLGYDRPRPITPAFGHAASPVVAPNGQWVVYVHSYERKDSLGLVDGRGGRWPVRLRSGADFYMQPAWHPSGDRLAWIEWDHPNMPWDGTRLCIGRFDPQTLALSEVTQMAGGADTPVFQPEFSPDGKWLAFITGYGEWDSLVVLDLQTGERRNLVSGSSLLQPAWVQGVRTIGWSPTSQSIYYLQNDSGFGSLWRVALEGGAGERIDLGPYTWLEQLAISPFEERLALVASAAVVPTRIITWSLAEGMRVVRRSESESIDPADLSVPQPMTWTGSDGAAVYGLYSAPASQRYTGTGLPPAIIDIHGGPTGQAVAAYSAETAFFTSRGYGVLRVNYRGSSGYGRSYLLALREHWGDLDVEDACSGAQALVSQALADPGRLVISGGSAGGFTVLNALCRYPGRFKAGLCSYGVSNLFTLATDTHKFEERYLDSMVGRLPEASARYHAWSPIFHADRIRDPLAVFQGSEDVVVPPDQSETIVAALKTGGVPHIYRLYAGEGHGFRKSETLLAHFADIERFLQQYVIFSAWGLQSPDRSA